MNLREATESYNADHETMMKVIITSLNYQKKNTHTHKEVTLCVLCVVSVIKISLYFL